MRHTYGRVPREVRPYLPALYDALKAAGGGSPYGPLADVFGCSRSRIQQIILKERKGDAFTYPQHGGGERGTAS